MVITSHIVWPWALLILIEALPLNIIEAATNCYLGEDLMTNPSIITDEGFYLLTNEVSCDGRIASIEVCGVFTSTNSKSSKNYFSAALYRRQEMVEPYSFERITKSEHLEPSIILLKLDGGVTCTRLSLTQRDDWTGTALKGDVMIGVSFVTSCEFETFEDLSYQSCPIHAAIQTNTSSDMVYFSQNVDIHNSSILLDELSMMTGVKINLRAIIEPLPPLFSEDCESHSEGTTSMPSKTEIIMDPSEQQLFTGSGTYIKNEAVECSGFVTSISYCGSLSDDGDLWPKPADYKFTLLHLRLSGDTYNIIDQEMVIHRVVDKKSTVTCLSHNISGLYALQGDHFGVVIPSQCDQKSNICPIQIGLINAGCEDTSLFVTKLDTRNSIAKVDTSHVAVKLNFKVEVDNCSPDLDSEEPVEVTQNNPHLPTIYGIIVLFFVIVVVLVVLSVILIVRLKCTKNHIFNTIKIEVRQGSTRLRNTLRQRNENESSVIHSLENGTYSEQNEYSSNYNRSLDTNMGLAKVQPRGDIDLLRCHQASLLTGSYEEPIDAIDHYEQCDTREDLYMDPPCKEIDLTEQLQKLEVIKENIQLKEYLGSGQFGIVYRGQLTVSGVDSEDGVKEVAVKTMENGASEEQRIKFLQEAAIMGQFNHPYIVKIYAVATSSQPYMIVCELMNKGDLRCYLHTVKVSNSQGADEIGAMLLNISRQVVSAMVYLSGKGFVHRDLAARNILVSMDGMCKVSDFGLSRDLQDEDYYVAHGGLIPVRWTAPEALKHSKYSTASDVWSYGIVLFEIWSLASRPYGTLTNEQVLHKVFGGYRLSSPSGCPRAVYALMISCWHPQAVQRPTFTQMHTSLQQPDNVLLEWTEDDRVNYSQNARTIGAIFQDGEVLHSTLQKTYVVSHTH